jgi:3-phenylpropionate/trans-cinnamate dioxygenase ferredoxin reductase subunit
MWSTPCRRRPWPRSPTTAKSEATPSGPNYADAAQVLRHLAAVAVDYDDVTAVLEQQGLDKFSDSWTLVTAELEEQLHPVPRGERTTPPYWPSGRQPRKGHLMTTTGFLIVGAGLAGALAAQTLRQEGFSGPITLVGEEVHRPYERPPLSKSYLQGDADRDSIYVHPERWYTDHDVKLALGTRATSLDLGAHTVTTSADQRLRYDKLLLATGSTPRRLTLPGAELDGIHYLRSVEDSDHIRTSFKTASDVVIIGAGWIGLETAAAARSAGLRVTLLEAAELPLVRILGPEAAAIFADLHRRHGVDLRCPVQVARLIGEGGRVTGVELHDGDVIAADLVLVGVGITPNVQLATDAGLHVDNGILVDQHLQTSDPDVYAAGDVANAWHPELGERLRIEHWANARRQGGTAAKTMLGGSATDIEPPYFFSDQYDLGLEYTGAVTGSGYDQVIFRRNPEPGEVIVFWLRHRQVLAGMNVNVWDATNDIQRLVQSSQRVDPGALANPRVPLSELAPNPPTPPANYGFGRQSTELV